MTLPKMNEPVGIIKNIEKTTKDLGLASALHAEGCRFLRSDKTDPTRQVFIFEGGENADRVEMQWFQDILVVSATKFYQSLRLMKSIIHS